MRIIVIKLIFFLFTQDCLHIRSLAPGTGSSVKLAKFFDKVISGRYHSNTRDREKRKKSTFPPGTKYFHGD